MGRPLFLVALVSPPDAAEGGGTRAHRPTTYPVGGGGSRPDLAQNGGGAGTRLSTMGKTSETWRWRTADLVGGGGSQQDLAQNNGGVSLLQWWCCSMERERLA